MKRDLKGEIPSLLIPFGFYKFRDRTEAWWICYAPQHASTGVRLFSQGRDIVDNKHDKYWDAADFNLVKRWITG